MEESMATLTISLMLLVLIFMIELLKFLVDHQEYSFTLHECPPSSLSLVCLPIIQLMKP